MRAFQFWILIFASTIVSALWIKQIFLTRELIKQHRTLVECQQVIADGNSYQNAWQKLAMSIYEASRQDPDLAAVLRSEDVEVHATRRSNSGAEAPPEGSVPAAPAIAPVAPAHPDAP